MRIPLLVWVTTMIFVGHAVADQYADMAQFAQSVCGDIPSGQYSKSTIAGGVKVNAPLLAKLLSGDANVGADKVDEVYNGIPFQKLPDNIPTVAMCKLELVKILIQAKK
jgi:hypothetical protein